MRLFTEGEAQRQRRSRRDRRAMQHVADFPGHLALRPDVRRYGVDRSGQPIILQRQAIQPDQVIDMDPGEPLPAIPERATGEEPERQDQKPEGRRPTSDDHRRADPHHPHAEGFRPGGDGLFRRGLREGPL